MNIYESSEDYLERILMLKLEKEKVISLDIANSFGYSKASISRAMKNLRENGYIIVSSDGAIELTKTGKEIAEKMFERHNTISSFFIKIGVNKETAYKDACKVEHDLSDETYNKIIDYINK